MSSIVDAARLMIERYAPSDTTDHTGHTWCGGCGNLIGVPYPCNDQIEHGDGCPSVTLPKILAALEAAQALVSISLEAEPHDCEYDSTTGEHGPVMAFCGASVFGPHLPGCSWLRLLAALQQPTGTAAR